MDLLEQCRLWHEAEEHEKIAQALEALPEEQRTPAMDMELARAYNNLAQPGEPEGREMLLRALELMARHEFDCPDPYSWNFRMGYACYYLDREGAALSYLERAMELHPGDSPQRNSRAEIRQLIDDCRHRLTLPRFERPFRRRVIEAWAEFARREEQLRRLLDAGEQSDALELAEGALRLAFVRPDFALRRDDGYELILSPGGRTRLFELVQFVRRMPALLAEHWRVRVDLSDMEDLPGAPEQGEDPAARLENSYVAYDLEPNEDPDADWRLDVIAGSTRCPELVGQYLQGESGAVDLLHDDGAAAGFICWPLDSFAPEERGERAFALRQQLEEVLTAAAGPEGLTLLGGAMGLFCGYLDFIAWDLPAVLDAAAEFFASSGLAWGSFHSFRRDVGTVRLWNAEEEKEPEVHPETGSLLSPEDIETMENYLEASSGYFYQVLEYLGDFMEKGQQEDRFTERQARRDLQIALWYAYACLNVDEYEYYYRAAQWLPASEPAAKGCGTWYYRYAAALMYCGRLEEARKYAEQGTVEEPDYPWAWLLTAKLRSHFGERQAALEAVERGLELAPGDYEFLTLRREIEAGATLEQMENHWIDPDFDRKLQAGQDEGAAAKLQAISCIVLNEAGLSDFFELFAPAEGDYSPNDPYCTFHRVVNSRRLEVAFLMNEAGLSKLGREWLRLQRDRLDSGCWLAPADPEGEPGKLMTVLFGLDRSVRLLGRSRQGDRRFQVLLQEDGTPASCEWWGPQPQPEEQAEAVPQWVYTEHQMELVEQHIRTHVGPFDQVFHELVSPDIHVDLCVVPPDGDRNFYTIVTMGMGARRMNVPPELAEHRLERAELAIALPEDWKLDQESLQDERWYWPLRLLKSLARLPGACDTWLGWGHTVDNQEPYAPDTGLCAAMLVGLQGALPGGDVCPLPDGDEINIYQVIPLHRAEMEYKQENGAEALLDHMDGVSFVVQPGRPCAALAEPDPDAFLLDDAAWHLRCLHEKRLAVESIAAYDHLAIYLRWCIERGLMSGEFLKQHRTLAEAVRRDGPGTDLRPFVRDALGGRLWSSLFSEEGRDFASYYYGENEAPSFPSDVDDWSLGYFGPVRYQSDEFRDEAYLFVPFDEAYYQGMAAVMDRRFACWKKQGDPFRQETDGAAMALERQVGAPCQNFPAMEEPDPLLAAFGYTRRQAVRDGYIPLLVAAEEGLWQGLEAMVLPETPQTADRPFARLWGENGRTRPAVLARIPASAPWEVFEKLPLGESGRRLAELACRWYEQYGAVPAALGAGWVEFTLPDSWDPNAGTHRERLALALAGRQPARLN